MDDKRRRADLRKKIKVKKLTVLSESPPRKELSNPDTGVDNEECLLEFFWGNKQCIMILLDKSQGTKYENFLEELELQLEGAFALFFGKYGVEMQTGILSIFL